MVRRSKGAENDFFPGFTDITEIGKGALATVYRARDLHTEQYVALKLLNVGDASPRAHESFARESIALSTLSAHPNIVSLFRSFPAADGRPVLVLELCRGSIGDRPPGDGLTVPQIVALGITIAGALETAHRAEILHRDVKPQNILVTERGEPALADFGVAILPASTPSAAGRFDRTTLHAAPELLEGRPASPATDVYALASSLYQLIAGRSAFRAFDSESPASVILRILRDPVPPLLSAQVPPGLSHLVVDAMAKASANRPASALEFARRLAAIEAEQGWGPTPFVIREPGGAVVTEPLAEPPRSPAHAGTLADDGWSAPSIVSRHAAVELPAEPEAAEPGPPIDVTHRRPIASMLPPPPLPPPPGALDEDPSIEVTRRRPLSAMLPPPLPGRDRAIEPPAAAEMAAASIWAQSPIDPTPVDPSGAYSLLPEHGSESEVPTATGPVPTWAFPAHSQSRPVPPSAPPVGDLTLDPAWLRRKVTIRSGPASVTVDETSLVARRWLRKSEIAWSTVRGFEPRFDGDPANGALGRLVAITDSGPVELPATKRSAADLRYVHALLEAYRQRARSRG